MRFTSPCTLTVVVALAVVAGSVPATAQNKCDSTKLKCMSKKALCLLKVHEKAIKKGEAPDAEKVAKCRAKFDDPAKGCVAKIEGKQNPEKPETLCTVSDHTAALEAIVDDCVDDALTGVANAGGVNKCDSSKLKCMRKRTGCLLKVWEKSIKKGEPLDLEKRTKCRVKFDDPVKGCIAKLEAKQDVAKPETVCTRSGDTAALETIVDECVSDALVGLTCGNDVVEAEACDGTDDSNCPGECLPNCQCAFCAPEEHVACVGFRDDPNCAFCCTTLACLTLCNQAVNAGCLSQLANESCALELQAASCAVECCADECEPQCFPWQECGLDLCGGTCGSCPAGEICEGGLCVAHCDEQGNAGCLSILSGVSACVSCCNADPGGFCQPSCAFGTGVSNCAIGSPFTENCEAAINDAGCAEVCCG